MELIEIVGFAGAIIIGIVLGLIGGAVQFLLFQSSYIYWLLIQCSPQPIHYLWLVLLRSLVQFAMLKMDLLTLKQELFLPFLLSFLCT